MGRPSQLVVIVLVIGIVLAAAIVVWRSQTAGLPPPRTQTDVLKEAIANLKAGRTAGLYSSQARDDDLAALESLQPGQLRFVHLSGPQITDAGLRHLARLRMLEVVGLVDTQVTSEGLENVRAWGRLRDLNLNSTKISSGALSHFAPCTNLEELRLRDTAIGDTDLAVVANFKRLRALSLVKTSITDEGLKQIAGLEDLEELRLSGTQITDAGLEIMKGLARLRALGLRDTKITDAGLAHLAGLSRLEELLLDNTAVTDAGVETLSALTNLKVLSLSGTKVTQAGLEPLVEKVRGIRQIWVDGALFSALDLGRIKQVNPDLEIVDLSQWTGAEEEALVED